MPCSCLAPLYAPGIPLQCTQLDVNIPFVTQAQQKRLTELKQAWEVQQKNINLLLEQDIARFNALSRESQLQQITLPPLGE